MYNLGAKGRGLAMRGTNNLEEEVVPDQESKNLSPQQPFSEEVEREREKKRTRELQPIFDELDDWRKKSLTAAIRV